MTEFNPPTRVLLADPPSGARHAVASMLRSLRDIVLVGEAGSADELRGALARCAPDVLVVDDRLLTSAWDSLAATRIAMVVLGLDDDPGFARRAQRLGAAAWIPKELAYELLPHALRRAHSAVGLTDEAV